MTDDLRERVAKLEVKISHLEEKLDEQTAILKRMDETFQQAKGARWVLLGMAGIAGFVAAKAPAFGTWIGIIK